MPLVSVSSNVGEEGKVDIPLRLSLSEFDAMGRGGLECGIVVMMMMIGRVTMAMVVMLMEMEVGLRMEILRTHECIFTVTP